MKKKIIASVLSMSMIFSSMSFNVLAEDVVSEVAETTAVEEATVEETSAEDAETVENADVVAETDEEDAGTTTASVALNAAVTEGWVGGNSGGSATTLTGDYSSTVSIQPTKEKKGKWSNTSDEIGYYGATVDASKDFTLSADVKVDQMNTLSTGSATQSTVGIGVFNDITTKTTNSIAMSLYAAKSSDTYMDYKASYREDATKRYWVGDLLSTNNVWDRRDGSITKTPFISGFSI